MKDGATEQDVSRDTYACERDMRQSGYYGGGIVGAVNAQGFYNRCMDASGYHRVATTNGQTTYNNNLPARGPGSDADLNARIEASRVCNEAGIKTRYPNYRACFFDHYKP